MQLSLFPASIEDYVSASDPVRAYDAFIDQLDLEELGIILDEDKIGNSEYEPGSMLKLLVYGYSYGHYSGRKLERALHHNVSFMWLMGCLRPDYRTITRFRRRHQQVLQKVLLYSARMCIDLKLVDGNVLFVDGSKIKGNASLDNKWDATRCDRVLTAVEKRIQELLEECERIDSEEESRESLVFLQDELVEKQKLIERVKSIADRVSKEPSPKKSSSASINVVDSDSKPMHSKKGSFSGYNAQAVTDNKCGIIVSSDVVNDRNDSQQLKDQIENGESTIQGQCKTVVADTGYYSLAEMKPLHENGRDVLVPNQDQSSHKTDDTGTEKKFFVYDKTTDSYTCPQGHTLKRSKTDNKARKIHYTIVKCSICKSCKKWGACTKAKNGRTIIRCFDEALREQLAQKYEEPSSREIYTKRKEYAERPFAHIKHNMGFNQFLLRGLEGVRAEFSMLCCGFNIKRAITELGGVVNLIAQLKPI